VRAFSGACLFGIPLLMTMEMWWLGQMSSTGQLLLMVVLALAATWGLALAAGFKRETSVRAAAGEAVEAVAVGIVVATLVLLALNRIAPGDPIQSILGHITVEMVPLSIGAALANAVFATGKSREGSGGGATPNGLLEVARDVSATAIGALFVSFSIAPTEEVPMLAAGMTLPHLLGLVALTLVITYAIVFASGFDPHSDRQDGAFQNPFTETTLAYAVSLCVAAVALLLFSRVDSGTPPGYVFQQVLVLGLPAAIGGAAGRLVA
jgi:putative integral membrane protein (TIGR02587 family)